MPQAEKAHLARSKTCSVNPKGWNALVCLRPEWLSTLAELFITACTTETESELYPWDLELLFLLRIFAIPDGNAMRAATGSCQCQGVCCRVECNLPRF